MRYSEFPAGSGINDGTLPTVYDTAWQTYDNLSPSQIAAFQSFPQDLLIYAGQRRWLAEISGVTVGGIPISTQDRDQAKIAQLKQAFDNGALTDVVSFSDGVGKTQTMNAKGVTAIYNAVVNFVQGVYEVYAIIKDGIKATPPTITKRSQIDAALAIVAPNSPSATNPGAP